VKLTLIILSAVADVITVGVFINLVWPIRQLIASQGGLVALVIAWAVGLVCSFVALFLARTDKELPAPKETVLMKTFENETVTLDGRIFRDCTFRDVLFRFSEKARFEIGPDCRIEGKKRIQFKGHGSDRTIDMLIRLGFMNREHWMRFDDEN
jgi:hypothetical protein